MSATLWWMWALVFVSGLLMPLQVGINGQVARQVSGGALSAALISFLVGTAGLLLICAFQRELPSFAQVRALHGWQWLGGLLGVFYVTVAAFCGPKIGAVMLVGLVLAGQLTMAMLLDHFGGIGFQVQPITLSKVGGILLVVAGVWLFNR